MTEKAAFALNGDQLASTLVVVIVLSFFIERALALLFENRWFVDRFASKGVKEPLALLLAGAVCHHWKFDALSIVLPGRGPSFLGVLVTAAIIAGGSKASIKLFHDVLGAMSNAEKRRRSVVKSAADVKAEGGIS